MNKSRPQTMDRGDLDLDDLLDKLVGRWSLTGTMQDGRLYQHVEAQPVLRGQFVEMHFSAVRVGEDNNPDYEALYLVGRDNRTGLYVLHLFDTYPVSTKPVPGIGKREGANTIRFQFDYEGGPWLNTFTWHPDKRSWSNTITYQKNGRTETFAEKELVLMT